MHLDALARSKLLKNATALKPRVEVDSVTGCFSFLVRIEPCKEIF